jgi:hypothetical protein
VREVVRDDERDYRCNGKVYIFYGILIFPGNAHSTLLTKVGYKEVKGLGSVQICA